MDFANERYVRIYTRDTPEMLATWPWETACLWWALIRKLDRAGCLDIGRTDPAIAIAAAIRMATAPQLETVRAALETWLEDGCLELRVLDGGKHVLVAKNYIDAQETPQSDTERARASRERRAARGQRRDLPEAVTIRDDDADTRDDESRNATEPSHGVTPCRAVPSVPNRAVPSDTPQSAPEEPSNPPPPVPRSRRPAKDTWTAGAARAAEDHEGGTTSELGAHVLAALRAHGSLEPIATPGYAEQLAVFALQRSKRRGAVEHAILQFATKRGSTGLSAAAMWEQLVGFVDRAKPPPDDGSTGAEAAAPAYPMLKRERELSPDELAASARAASALRIGGGS